jgi:hypothetical protein
MTAELGNLPLPKSVSAYLAEPATRAAVDALLAVDPRSLPPEIEWKELEDYFAARAVAELTRAEFALAFQLLWRSIWEPLIPGRWKLPPPEKLLEDGQAVSTGEIWEQKCFSLYHECGDLYLYTLVGLHRRRVTVAFSFERRDKQQLSGELGGFTWRNDANWEGWMLLTPGISVNRDGRIDLSELEAAAKLAIAKVEALIEAAKRAPASRPASGKPKARTGRGKN